MKDYYVALSVSRDASPSDVKVAYRKLAAKYHPDRNTDADAPEKFRVAQEAYDVLSDEAKRRAYDESRRRSLVDNPLETAKQLWKHYLQKVLS
jgi:DnaJ-class molecular chaperone